MPVAAPHLMYQLLGALCAKAGRTVVIAPSSVMMAAPYCRVAAARMPTAAQASARAMWKLTSRLHCCAATGEASVFNQLSQEPSVAADSVRTFLGLTSAWHYLALSLGLRRLPRRCGTLKPWQAGTRPKTHPNHFCGKYAGWSEERRKLCAHLHAALGRAALSLRPET